MKRTTALFFIICALFSQKVFAYESDYRYGNLTFHCYQYVWTTTQYCDLISCNKTATGADVPWYIHWNGSSTYLTSIGDTVFQNCSALTQVTIRHGSSMDSYLGIGRQCFENCTNLQTVSFTTTYSGSQFGFGKKAFNNCPKLKSISITDAITAFHGDSAFYGSSISNPIYNSHHFFHLPTSKSGTYSIPSGITTLGAYAFQDCHSITNVALPSTLTSIEDYAFKNCTGLTSISIPSSVQEIASTAFSGCTHLNSVNASGSTDNMTWSLQNGTLVISCTGMITSAPWNAFSSFIQNVQVTGTDGSLSWSLNNGLLTVSGLDESFALTDYTAPWYLLNSYVSRVSVNGTFAGSSWTLQNGVLSISYIETSKQYPWAVFQQHVQSVEFQSGVESIPSNAFNSYYSIQSVSLSSTVDTILSKAFYSCSQLQTISGGDGLMDVATDAFPDCAYSVENYIKYIGTYLMGVTTQNLPSYSIKSNTKVIGRSAFNNCTRLTSIDIPQNVYGINKSAFSGCNRLTTVTGMSNVTYIGDYCFSGCSALISINLSPAITSIGDNAFYDCSSLISTGSNFSNMSVLKKIGSNAFYNCSSLPITNLSFGNSLKEIGSGAFSGCNIVSVEIPYSTESIGSQAFALQTLKHVRWNAKNCKIGTYGTYGPFVNYYNYDRNKTCPVETLIFGNGVEVLPWALAYGMEKLTSVTIPESVDSIEVVFNTTNNNLDTIIWNAKNCKSPSNNYYIPLKELKKQIKSFVIGKNVESIPDYLCSEMQNVSPITIPNSVKHIGKAAFRGSNVKSISNNVEHIEEASFKNCSRLPYNLSLSPSLITIGDSAFYHCDLTSIVFPSSLRSIGKCVFAEHYGFQSSLSQMTSYASIVPVITSQTFLGVSTDVIVYVKDSVAFDYMLDINWGLFDIRSITANNVSVNGVSIMPGDDDVTIAWPEVANASYYDIEIQKNGEIVATLRFGADGKLLNIYYAPSRVYSSTTNGFSYTISGLEYATVYHYSIQTKNNLNNVISNLTGTFATNGLTYQVTCVGNNCTFRGVGAYFYGSQATVKVIPNSGYHFVKWSDDSTDNPRIISVESDTTLSAIVEINKYAITAKCEHGSVINIGEYEHGTSVCLEIIPKDGYQFDHWSNGSVQNPYCFIASEDISLTGYVVPSTDAVNNIKVPSIYQKTIENGSVLILKNGKRYTMLGQEK